MQTAGLRPVPAEDTWAWWDSSIPPVPRDWWLHSGDTEALSLLFLLRERKKSSDAAAQWKLFKVLDQDQDEGQGQDRSEVRLWCSLASGWGLKLLSRCEGGGWVLWVELQPAELLSLSKLLFLPEKETWELLGRSKRGVSGPRCFEKTHRK